MLNQRNKGALEQDGTPKARKPESEAKAKDEKAPRKAASPAPARKKPTVKKTGATTIATARVKREIAPVSTHLEITREEIANLAYRLWESRGRCGGSPEEDWLKAEVLLRSGSKAVS